MELIPKRCKLEGNDIRQLYNIQVFKTSKTSEQGSPQILASMGRDLGYGKFMV